MGKLGLGFGLSTLFWLGLLLGNQVLVTRDLGATHIPWRLEWTRQVKQGWWPLWNPRANGGRPLWADPNSQSAYPPTALFLVLPPAAAMTTFLALHHLGLLAGLAFLARRAGASPEAAAAAGAILGTSGVALSLTTFPNSLASAAWLPWAWALALPKQPGGRTAGPALFVAGGLLGVSFLAGEPVTAALGLAGAWVLGRQALAVKTALLVAGFFLLAMPVLVPLWQLFPETVRGAQAVSSQALAADCLAPRRLLELFFPRLLGSPLGDATSGFWAAPSFPWQRYYPLIFLGAGTVALLLAGLGQAKERSKKWLALGLFGLLLALLPALPWGGQLLRLLPGGQFWRYAIKGLQVSLLAFAPLAAWGLEAFASKRRFWPLLGLATAFLLLPLASPWTQKLLENLYPASAAQLAQVSPAELRRWWLADGLANALPLTLLGLCLRPKLVVVGFLAVQWPLFFATHQRISNHLWWQPPELLRQGKLGEGSVLAVFARPSQEGKNPTQRVLAYRNQLLPDYGLVYGLAYALARGPDGLELWRGELAAAAAAAQTGPGQEKVAAALGATAVVTDKPWATGACAPVASVSLCLPTAPSPPFYLARRAFPAEDVAAAVAWMASPAFHPGQDMTLPNLSVPLDLADGEVWEMPGSPHHRRFRVKAQGKTWLVIQQNYSQQWQGQVDGKPVPLAFANFARLAIPVEAGEHWVEVFLDPRPYLLGLLGPPLFFLSLALWRRQVRRASTDGPGRSSLAKELAP